MLLARVFGLLSGRVARRARRVGGFRLLPQAEVFEVRRPWTLAAGWLLPTSAERAWSLPVGRRPSSDVRHGSFAAAVLSRGLWPDSPGALGAGGFCLQAEVLRSDALRLSWQTAGSLGPERLRAPPAVGSYPPEPTTTITARDPSGAVAPWSSRPIRPEVWRLADTVCRRRFLRSDALRLGLRYVALPCLRASGDGSCPRGSRFPGLPPTCSFPACTAGRARSSGTPHWPGGLAVGGLLSRGGGFEVRRPLPSAVNLRWLWRRACVEPAL